MTRPSPGGSAGSWPFRLALVSSEMEASAVAGAERQDHYEVLGVTRRADHEQIRRAYLDAARRWHPDRFSGRPAGQAEEAERAMRRVTQAWSVLGDQASRAAYDRQLEPRAPSPGDRPPVATTDGVTRIDPRLLDPRFLAARREAQLDRISGRSSLVLRAAPVVAVLGLLAAILVFTAYARNTTTPPVTSVPGPSLGAGIDANDCVQVMSGPSLIETDCEPTAAGRVIGAHEGDGECPPGTSTEVELTNGLTACLATVR